MPFIISPSKDTTKAWRGLASWLVPVELTLLALANVTFLFSTGLAGMIAQHGYPFMGEAATINMYVWCALRFTIRQAFRMVMPTTVFWSVLPPLFTIVFSAVHLWLCTIRYLSPARLLPTTFIFTVGWIATTYTQQREVFNTLPNGTLEGVVGGFRMGGSIALALVYLIYLVISIIALYRLRKYGRAESENGRSPTGSAHELASRNVSPTNSAVGPRVEPTSVV